MSQPVRARLFLLGLALGIIALAEWISHAGVGGGVHTHLINYFHYGDAFFSACWLASALIFASSRRNWRSLAAYVAVGAVCEALVAGMRHEPGYGYRLYAGGLFGIVAFAWASVEALIERTEAAVLVWLETIIFPALLLAAIMPLDLTTYLHPTSLDGRMLLLEDSLFGGQPGWAMGRFFEAHGVFSGFETLIYVYLPTASGVIYLLERKSGRRNDLQVAFITAGIIGIVLLQLAPVAGPTSFRPDYPDLVPRIDDALEQKMVAGMRWRNSIPSLHTTWSLFIYWHARPHGLRPRILGAFWVVLTILAMLGLGEHFLADVPITIPFAVAMRAVLTSNVDARLRRHVFTVGALFYIGWVGILRAPEHVLANGMLLRAYAVLGVGLSLFAERQLYLASLRPVVEGETAKATSPLLPRWVYGALFANGLLLAASVRTYRDVLETHDLHRGALPVAILGVGVGALAGKKVGAVVANAGFAAAAVVAYVGWDYLPAYLHDFDAVTWGDGVRWLIGDVMTVFFIGPGAFFAGAAVTSALPERKLPAIGAAALGLALGAFISTTRLVYALVAIPLAIAAAFRRT